EVAFLDEAFELGRAGDVAALADHDEVGLGADDEDFLTRVVGPGGDIDVAARRHVFDLAGEGGDPFGRRAAAAADAVDPALACEPAEGAGRTVLAEAAEAAHAVGQAGVGIDRDRLARDAGEAFDGGADQVDADAAVEADGQGVEMRNGDVE